MDSNNKHRHTRTVPIRKRYGESSHDSTSSDVEGTFIPLSSADCASRDLDFINNRFTEDEDDEDIISVVDLQTEEKPPLLLLFPDLGPKDMERLARTTSTTQVAQILIGKKADFSLLKPSKKLNPEQCPLPPLVETVDEYLEDEELGN